jgi:hypothetical protein
LLKKLHTSIKNTRTEKNNGYLLKKLHTSIKNARTENIKYLIENYNGYLLQKLHTSIKNTRAEKGTQIYYNGYSKSDYKN